MKPDQLSEKEIMAKFYGGMSTAESGRADGLQKLQSLQEVKDRSQIKEHRRLKTKLGAQHPRVRQLKARIQYNEGLAGDLGLEIEKSKIDTPKIDEQSGMVHGRVMDTRRVGRPGLTIGIFDADGRWVRPFGYACTDERGYFSIVIRKEESQDKTQKDMRFYLHIIGPDARLVHKDPEPLGQAPGRIEYREIFLERGQADCREPQNGGNDSDLPTCGPWVLHGKVTNTAGQPQPNLIVIVSVKDKEGKLGYATTEENGSYRVTYTAEDTEEGPLPGADLLVVVIDSNKEPMYRSEDEIVYMPGQTVEFDIRIDA